MKLKRIKNKIVSAQGTKKTQNKKNSHFIVICNDKKIVLAFFYSAIRTALTKSVKTTANSFLYNLTHYWYIHIYFF